MLYMVIETFWPGAKDKITERMDEKGRMLPKGLRYLNSWIETGGNRCFQLMETDDKKLFATWTAGWRDLVEFRIIPVEESPYKKREASPEPAPSKPSTRRK
jgi:hypothetical protein